MATKRSFKNMRRLQWLLLVLLSAYLPSSAPTVVPLESCQAWYDDDAGVDSGVYEMADGTRRECDQTTDGGSWTLVARVNTAFDWICPDAMAAGASNCLGASTTLVPRSNLWHDSHWAGNVTVAPGAAARSGVSTEPSLVRAYRGSSSYDVRFSFYASDADVSPSVDGYATFPAPTDDAVLFSDDPSANGVQAAVGTDCTWTTLSGTISPELVCWSPNAENNAQGGRGYEGSSNMHALLLRLFFFCSYIPQTNPLLF